MVGDVAMGYSAVALFRVELIGKAGFAVPGIAVFAAAALALAAIAGRFSAYGFDAVPFVVCLVVGLVAGAAVYILAAVGKLAPKIAAPLSFVLVFAGIAVARYFFYTASIL